MTTSLKHYGVPRRSGRYPWGSGEDPEQRNTSFLGQVSEMRKQGLSDTEIATGLGMNTSQFRNKVTVERAAQRKSDVAQAWRLKEKGYSDTEIGNRMGKNESSIRSLLNPTLKARSEVTETTANMLKEAVENKTYLDVGVGVERHMGISRTKLKASISMLEEEGYKLHYIKVPQLGTDHQTSVMVLTKPGVEYNEVYKNRDNIKGVTDYSEDGGRSYLGLEPVQSISSKRIKIRYSEDGGSNKDGVIELREGVEDLSLGSKRYAQVRIGVDGTHYMKGMAMYSTDLPPGIDAIYNTNKSKDVPKEKVFKSMKDDPDNPFGSSVRQRHYLDADGKKQLSAINIVGTKEGSGEEGGWETWSKNLSSQFLSKQNPSLAKKQLGLAFDDKMEEYNRIMSLTNPAVRKKLLDSFSDSCDSDAVHLKAAAMPRQRTHVILPIPSLKENEVYAPNYNDGENVVLIRYPHGGIFEIPELKVNNRHAISKKVLGDVKDAVGINPKVAEKLSGADFDGDTVIVIPNGNKLIKTAPTLKALKDFDPKALYKLDESAPKMSSRTKGLEMGKVSNLITDMTIKGANPDEIARAVRHSMVVIDAEKHHLNYKQSAIDNNIADLKKKYQGGVNKGASTLISRASSDKYVDYREEGKKVTDPNTGKTKRLYIDPITGKKLYETTGESYVNKNGKIVIKKTKSSKMYEAEDAFELSSGMPIETVYAHHANKLKALANQARKDYISTPSVVMSPSAKKVYEKEVQSLNAKLNLALKNSPMERQAQILANSIVKAKKEATPDLDPADLKKIKGMALIEARSRVGAKKVLVDITDKEWEAIQSGAISNNKLIQILNNSDENQIKKLATPRSSKTLSTTQKNLAKRRLASGYTRAEVAESLGVSISMIDKILD